MPRLWRYKRDGQEFGPVTPDDLKMLAKSQRLGLTDLVCKDGTNHWFPARGIRGLFPRPTVFGRFTAWIGPTGLVCTVLALLLIGGGVAFLLYALHTNPPPSSEPPPVVPHHTRLLNALHEMREARGELQGGDHDLGDRLEEVSDNLEKAIKQTEKALTAVGVSITDLKDDPDAYKKYPKHPHLNDARDEIIKAIAEISGSKDDLGGEKERTLKELDRVKDQLQRALEHEKN